MSSTRPRHLFQLQKRLTRNTKLELTFLVLSYMAIGFIRLVFLLFYKRIFRGLVFNVICYTLIALVCMWSVVFTVAELSSCGSHLEVRAPCHVNKYQSCADIVTGILVHSEFIEGLLCQYFRTRDSHVCIRRDPGSRRARATAASPLESANEDSQKGGTESIVSSRQLVWIIITRVCVQYQPSLLMTFQLCCDQPHQNDLLN